jgi:hypothetical protein
MECMINPKCAMGFCWMKKSHNWAQICSKTLPITLITQPKDLKLGIIVTLFLGMPWLESARKELCVSMLWFVCCRKSRYIFWGFELKSASTEFGEQSSVCTRILEVFWGGLGIMWSTQKVICKCEDKTLDSCATLLAPREEEVHTHEEEVTMCNQQWRSCGLERVWFQFLKTKETSGPVMVQFKVWF